MKKLWYAAVLVVVANGVVLGKAAINRHWGEVQRLDLTERELSLPYYQYHEGTRSLSLSWQGNVAGDKYLFHRSYNVKLSEASFAALGGAEVVCDADFKRQSAYVLLVYGGQPYTDLLAQYRALVQRAEAAYAANATKDNEQALERARRNLLSQEQGASRLIAVDAALTQEPLLERAATYDEPHWVLPARLSAVGQCKHQEVYVRLTGVQQFHLSRRQSEALKLSPSQRRYDQALDAPRYRASLAIGSLGLPWVERVAKCEGEC